MQKLVIFKRQISVQINRYNLCLVYVLPCTAELKRMSGAGLSQGLSEVDAPHTAHQCWMFARLLSPQTSLSKAASAKHGLQHKHRASVAMASFTEGSFTNKVCLVLSIMQCDKFLSC